MKPILLLLNLFLIPVLSNAAKPQVWGEKDFDFVVVGAGAAGAIVAARLSEDPKMKVALLEAGGEPYWFTDIPYFAHGPLGGEIDWNYHTEKQDNIFLGFLKQQWIYPRGKCLGGSTQINGLAYTRCNRRDFDLWEEMGNKGWSYDNILPYYLKLEDYQAPIKPEDEPYHAKGGPVAITAPAYTTEFAQAFLDAGVELGYKVVDSNGKTQTGFTTSVYALRNGTRGSSYNEYLKPIRDQRKNLHIITNALVTKVNVNDNKQATGVLFEKDGKLWSINSKKEVILSAGSLGTPHILMLSGIGPKETLEKFQIPVVSDVPGIGQNLLDHLTIGGITFTTDNYENPLQKERAVTPDNLELWELKREGPLTVPIKGAGMSFIHSKYSDPSVDYPDIELQFCVTASLGLNIDPDVYKAAFGPKDGKEMVTIYPLVLRPKSVGHITLQSSDPHVPPLFYANFLDHPDDMKLLIEAIKTALKVMETKAFKKFNVQYHGRPFPGCEHLELHSDEYWECFIRHYAQGMYHQSGTCKMAPSNDPMKVVDSSLKVYGIKGLRVIDLSITPTIVTGHTMAPALMIGEKGADLVKEDWGLRKKDEL